MPTMLRRPTGSRASCAATPTRYDPATQTLRSTNRYEIYREDGHVEHRITDLDWHIYFPEELSLLLEAAGLDVVERYGDYDRSPWNAASRRYLWLAAGHDTAREG